jgi:hypothetical protein
VVAGDDELVNGSVSRRESCTVKKSRTGKTKKKIHIYVSHFAKLALS